MTLSGTTGLRQWVPIGLRDLSGHCKNSCRGSKFAKDVVHPIGKRQLVLHEGSKLHHVSLMPPFNVRVVLQVVDQAKADEFARPERHDMPLVALGAGVPPRKLRARVWQACRSWMSHPTAVSNPKLEDCLGGGQRKLDHTVSNRMVWTMVSTTKDSFRQDARASKHTSISYDCRCALVMVSCTNV